MFAGIVEATGRIISARQIAANLTLTIHAGGLDLSDAAVGDSIAVSGVCLTATRLGADEFEADVSPATQGATRGFIEGEAVNLERSLRFGDRVHGHLVLGHVDGVGTVQAFTDLGASWRLEVAVPTALAAFIALKGSLTVDGVSLTLNRVTDTPTATVAEMNLIPHTLAATTSQHLRVSGRVNLEVDMMARYLQRLLAVSGAAGNRPSGESHAPR